MMLSNVFSNMFDDMMFDYGFGMPERSRSNLMDCDVKEYDDHYELGMDLPGYKKSDIKAELKDGYLTIQAERHTTNDERDDLGHVIRNERFTGACRRSFYVGEHVTRENVSAAYEDGVLRLSIPKMPPELPAEEMKYIDIQ